MTHHRFPLRVYYEDTDFSGVVYHASYLRFFERGRTEFIRSCGIDQQALHRETGVYFVVRRMAVDWLKPALMDDELVVETKAVKFGGASMELSQRILRGNEVLTTAEVLVVILKEGRPTRLPDSIRAQIPAG
ncbi:tol-pal system-associated acyl-CoA thioesterase [Rhizobiales bacterium TNE-4]|nr:tol-pal system-associated acyl-CoA thioesterase [Rhizobiales bacterium TNE-4]MBV1827929.1 tol-pal system-associated acyl-CoA thioesterase [Rhizobiales bacterium TNE-4]